jgi:hypothetical protein
MVSRESLRQRGNDVGLAEVLALKKRRLASSFRKRVREAIAKIDAGRMAAFPVIGKSLPREERLLFREWLDGYTGRNIDSQRRTPATPVLDSRMMETSTNVGAEILGADAVTIACSKASEPASQSRIAMRAELSTIIWEGHFHRRAFRRGQ